MKEKIMSNEMINKVNELRKQKKIKKKIDKKKAEEWKDIFQELSEYTDVTGPISCYIFRHLETYTLGLKEILSYTEDGYYTPHSILEWGINNIIKYCPLVYKKIYKKLIKKINKQIKKYGIDISKPSLSEYCSHCGLKRDDK